MEHAHAKRLSWIAAIVVSACLCLAAWLISGWINLFGNDAMLTDVVLLPCSASQKVKVWENGVIYSDGTSLLTKSRGCAVPSFCNQYPTVLSTHCATAGALHPGAFTTLMPARRQ